MSLQEGRRKVATVSDFRFTGKVLGKGNFARVEEAVHEILNVKVAVKIIDVNQIGEKYILKNLHREACMMSKLSHPCIATLFETMQLADNVYYLVTEFIAGGDLHSFIKGQRNGKLDENTTRAFAQEFVSALSHMHNLGVVHRDLKMENVMLNSSRTHIKIVDFGLSNVWTIDNPLRTHCGSPEYAAPELFIAGRKYGPEVDIWSLGIILYGMVVGDLPFVNSQGNHVPSQERRIRLVEQINRGLATPQRQAIAHLSMEFRSMMSKLLVADSSKRITIRELIIHPWITERGRKIVLTNPIIRKSEALIHAKILQDMGEAFEISRSILENKLLKLPYGRLGCIYNILKYKETSRHLPIDFVTEVRMPTSSKVSKEHPRSAPPQKQPLYSQCVMLLNKIYNREMMRTKSAPKKSSITNQQHKINPSREGVSQRQQQRAPLLMSQKAKVEELINWQPKRTGPSPMVTANRRTPPKSAAPTCTLSSQKNSDRSEMDNTRRDQWDFEALKYT